MYEMIETVFKDTLNYAILVVEVIGVVMLLVTAIQALFVVFKSKAKCRHMLGDGISTALRGQTVFPLSALMYANAPRFSAAGL